MNKDLRPDEIEKRSFEIIGAELDRMGIVPDSYEAPVIMRAIHATADFDYAGNLWFSEGAVRELRDALRSGACIVTDTQMALSGINKARLSEYGGQVFCFMSDQDIARESKRTGKTRAALSMDKAASLKKDLIFAIGNAPTALLRLHELITEDLVRPKGIIAAPVGFVNVVEAKELIMGLRGFPLIVARGRKGGSGVAAAIVNALIYYQE